MGVEKDGGARMMSLPISRLLCRVYSLKSGFFRSLVRRLAVRMEGGELRSATLREVFRRYHGVDVGLYTHGGCFVPHNFGRYTRIGRYSSIAMTARAFTRDHPLDWKSMHALFFNPTLGFCASDPIEHSPLQIGNDVWLGEGAMIMAGVSEIGDGAVVGAGAVVHKNVPPYAVVVGNPARVVRYRFLDPVIQELLASKWWDRDVEEIRSHMADFRKPYGDSRPPA